MQEVLTEFSIPALVGSIESNQVEQLSLLSRTAKGELHNEQDTMWFTSGIPSVDLNGVARSLFAEGRVDSQIDTIMNEFKLRRMPMNWWVFPSSRPADLDKRLEAHGLRYSARMHGMVIDLESFQGSWPTPPYLTIERVNDTKTLKKFMTVLSIGFNINPFIREALLELWGSESLFNLASLRHYVASVNEQPAATCTLLLAAGVGGIYHVTTVPCARRQGIGTAITLAALNDARGLGYRAGVLIAAEKAVGMYLRMGFREYCEVKLYAWSNGATSGGKTGYIRQLHRYISWIRRYLNH